MNAARRLFRWIRSDRQGLARVLGELELAILEALWRHEEATVRQVLATFGAAQPLAYTTILTVLQRLYRKGLVDRRREGLADRYWAAYTRAELEAEVVHMTVDALLADYPTASLRHFVSRVGELDNETLAELERLISAREQRDQQ